MCCDFSVKLVSRIICNAKTILLMFLVLYAPSGRLIKWYNNLFLLQNKNVHGPEVVND